MRSIIIIYSPNVCFCVRRVLFYRSYMALFDPHTRTGSDTAERELPRSSSPDPEQYDGNRHIRM